MYLQREGYRMLATLPPSRGLGKLVVEDPEGEEEDSRVLVLVVPRKTAPEAKMWDGEAERNRCSSILMFSMGDGEGGSIDFGGLDHRHDRYLRAGEVADPKRNRGHQDAGGGFGARCIRDRVHRRLGHLKRVEEEKAELLRARWLGREDFERTLQRQLEARDALISGSGTPRVFAVEHPPTLTMGRRAKPEHVLWSPERLQAAGMAVCETPRGGEVTLHAPGQLVLYPVVQVGRKIREHIVRMAEVTIELIETLGIDGCEFRMEHPGVWRGDSKLASIGIHISRGVSVQGLSLNLSVRPGLFASLVSCGLPQVEMSNVADLCTSPLPPMASLAKQWAEGFARRRGSELSWSE